MKKLLLSLLLVSIVASSMEHVQDLPQASEGAANAIHEQQLRSMHPSFSERCAEGIVTGLVTNLAVILVMDLYQGSKGYTYRLLFGPSDQEKQTALEIVTATQAIERTKIENLEKIREFEERNAQTYIRFMEQRIASSDSEHEKKELKERLKNTMNHYTQKQEYRLIRTSDPD